MGLAQLQVHLKKKTLINTLLLDHKPSLVSNIHAYLYKCEESFEVKSNLSLYKITYLLVAPTHFFFFFPATDRKNFLLSSTKLSFRYLKTTCMCLVNILSFNVILFSSLQMTSFFSDPSPSLFRPVVRAPLKMYNTLELNNIIILSPFFKFLHDHPE